MKGVKTVSVTHLEKTNLDSATVICCIIIKLPKQQHNRHLSYKTATTEINDTMRSWHCTSMQSPERSADRLVDAKTNRPCQHELIIW